MIPKADTFPAGTKPPFRPSEKNIKSGKMHPRSAALKPRLAVARKEWQPPAGSPKLKMKAPWVLSGILFDFDRATIKPGFRSMLDRAVAVLKKNSALQVEIQGHTDGRGPAAYNQRLSQKRALAVMRYFVEQGIRRERLSARGFGESRPVGSNATKAGRARNRRVELKAKEAGVFAAR